MTQTITVNAVDRSGVIRRNTVEWAENAYLGEVAEGGFTIDDSAGSITVPGFKDITVEQSSSTPSRIFTGFAGRKSIRRGDTYQVGASREYVVTTRDLNDLLRRHIIQGTGAAAGNRPSETVDARMTWLLASDFVDFADRGAVTASTVVLDKHDLRGMYAGDVLAEMAKAVNFNYYIRYHASGPELVFRDDNASSADTCTLSISNVASDHSATVLPPFQEAELAQDPEHVYSGLYGVHSKGQVYETLAATAATFVERDGTLEDSGTRSDATMARDAQQQLRESNTEEQLLPVTIQLTAAQVGLVQAGQRIATRMTHMEPEGWDPARYARILRKRIVQPKGTDFLYYAQLDLSPQEVPPAADVCNDLYDPTASATYYPLGGSGTTPNVSDGVVYYYRGGWAQPLVPTPGWAGQWHFPLYGAGGTGTIDFAGDCTFNWLILMTVGNGTWTIQTEDYASSPRLLQVFTGPTFVEEDRTQIAVMNSGDSIVVTHDDTSDGDCIRIVGIVDPGLACGGKWGWSQAVWVAA